jgi:hypothetical protein
MKKSRGWLSDRGQCGKWDAKRSMRTSSRARSRLIALSSNLLGSLRRSNKGAWRCVLQALCWIRPPRGLVKINVDTKKSKNLGWAAATIVAWDEDGYFLCPGDGRIRWRVEVVEAVACNEGLSLASDLGFHSFRVASDCANTVWCIQGKGFATYGPIVRETNARRRSFTREDFVFKGLRSTPWKDPNITTLSKCWHFLCLLDNSASAYNIPM